MHAEREKSGLLLSFNIFESRLLRRVLQSVAEQYRLKPGEIDPAVANAWYSTRGCVSARMSAEEVKDWVDNLHHLKLSHLELLKRCITQLAVRKNGHYQISISLDEAPALLTMLNDHRLLASARHGIGQDEMDLHSLREITRLNTAKQTALYEIHLLAYIMESLLRVLPGGD